MDLKPAKLTRSLSFRLIAVAGLWIGLTLVVSGFALSAMLRANVESSFDRVLLSHLEELLALSNVTDGKITLSRRLLDPEYHRPLSGWYWQIVTNGKVVDRSRSLWDEVLPFDNLPARGVRTAYSMDGPRKATLRVGVETISIPGHAADVSIIVTAPATVVEESMAEFNEALIRSLVLLGVGLAAAVFLQVRYGLLPLVQMRRVLADIHAGRAARMHGDFAVEVQPLADDLNALLDHNEKVTERARTQAGNLAHALKTPLAVLANEATSLQGGAAETLTLQVSLMSDLISRHLSRARAAGAYGIPGAVCDLYPLVAGLARTLRRIYERRGIEIELVGIEGRFLKCEKQDLEEILGNLMDNACKWAKNRVCVEVLDMKDGFLTLSVSDDGPGIPDDLLAAAMKRGQRLDEDTPGSGLGLSIVTDLAELYGGRLELARAPMGGLLARIVLPGR